ncbi:MAG: hypothetical protein ACREPR_15630 [Brasilonema sp.]
MKPRITATLVLLTTLASVTPALAQGRLDRPSFFQDGQDLMNQEIQRLQQQQQQQQQQGQVEHPSQLLTINDNSLRWQKFIFRNGSFSVWMPEGTQSQESVALETIAGELNFEVFATHPQSSRFIAAYSNPIDASQLSKPDAILDSVRDGIIAAKNFKLINDRSITLEQYPGRQLSMENSSGEAINFRVYLINQRVYVLAASQKNMEGPSQDVVNFFDSFRLLQ